MTDLLGGQEVWNEHAQALSSILRVQGWTDDDVRAILNNKTLAQEVAKVFIAASPTAQKSGSGAPEAVYPVTVREDRTLEEMVEAGRYDWKSRDITYKFFPDSGPVGEYELVLVHLNRDASTEEVLAELKRLGLEPAFIGMLLAFGERYPEIQRDFPVVALASVCVCSVGLRCSPSLGVHGRKRRLYLRLIAYDWSDLCRFLAFRRKVK